MKTYFTIIKNVQNFLIALGISLLIVLPPLTAFWPYGMPYSISNTLYACVHILLLFVMTIRPLADIWTTNRYIRPLVQLRKGAGIVASAIIVSFMLAKIIIGPAAFFSSFTTLAYWSLEGYALFAHLADITGVILLITSNNASKRLLGNWWKKIQRLSYIFFYASGIFVYANYHDNLVLIYMIIVTVATITAWHLNAKRRKLETK